MPKEENVESKKKMVVVEEVSPAVVEVPKVPEVAEVPKVEKIEESVVVESEAPAEVVNVEEESEKTNYLWIIIPTALLIGALVGGLITYFSGIAKLKTDNATPSPVPSVVPEASSTPMASPPSTLKKDDLKVQILNGSGVSGAAGKAKALLEAAGYKNIDTGNATISDLAQTEVSIKDAKKEYLDTVIKDLAKSYSAVEATKPLVTTSKFDIVVTLGKK